MKTSFKIAFFSLSISVLLSSCGNGEESGTKQDGKEIILKLAFN